MRKEGMRGSCIDLVQEDRDRFLTYARLLRDWNRANQRAYVHLLNLTDGLFALRRDGFESKGDLVERIRSSFPSVRMTRYLQKGHNLTHSELRQGAERLEDAWTSVRAAIDELDGICDRMIETKECLESKDIDYDDETTLFFLDGLLCMTSLNEVFSEQVKHQRITLEDLGFDTEPEVLQKHRFIWNLFRSLKQGMKEDVMAWATSDMVPG